VFQVTKHQNLINHKIDGEPSDVHLKKVWDGKKGLQCTHDICNYLLTMKKDRKITSYRYIWFVRRTNIKTKTKNISIDKDSLIVAVEDANNNKIFN